MSANVHAATDARRRLHSVPLGARHRSHHASEQTVSTDVGSRWKARSVHWPRPTEGVSGVPHVGAPFEARRNPPGRPGLDQSPHQTLCAAAVDDKGQRAETAASCQPWRLFRHNHKRLDRPSRAVSLLGQPLRVRRLRAMTRGNSRRHLSQGISSASAHPVISGRGWTQGHAHAPRQCTRPWGCSDWPAR